MPLISTPRKPVALRASRAPLPAATPVEFESRGETCRGRLHLPAGDGPFGCVVLAHGFAGTREQRLDTYAERFAQAGLAALAFDYRCFGYSKGEPRGLYSNHRQLQDWKAAIAFAAARHEVDPQRIALWGTSTSGGHVIRLAADDGSVRAVVAQMPWVSGFAQLRSMPITQSLALVGCGLVDRIGALLGRDPFQVKTAGRPLTLAAVTSPDALSGLAAITPRGKTRCERVPARFALTTIFYAPGRAAKRLSCPLLVCIADDDRVIPAAPALKLARRGELRRYKSSHFGMYYETVFDEAVADQADFLCRHLRPASGAEGATS